MNRHSSMKIHVSHLKKQNLLCSAPKLSSRVEPSIDTIDFVSYRYDPDVNAYTVLLSSVFESFR